MPVPLVDLTDQYQQLAKEIQAGWEQVLEEGTFVLSDEVARFETAYAAFCEVGYCVGVANGTDALELALRAIGVGSGDEVIMPANSFIATPLAVIRAGATPAFVDAQEESHLIDPDLVGARLNSRTKAVVPVHLFGQLAPMESLQDVAAGTDVRIVEDAAQAHGARRNGVGAGNFGVVAATSFYPAKNLGAYGDAGAVLTNDEHVAHTVRCLRNYGSETKYDHPMVGFNSRLDALQAVVLNVKLARLEVWNSKRRAAAMRYDELLSDLESVRRPQPLPGNEHVWHLYVVRVRDRDRVLRKLNEAGIGAGVHYPVPLHLQGALRALGHSPGDFPVAERASREILSLPMFPEITAQQQEEVVDRLRDAVG
jgi:dTDP-4-amino-4,6-dideoxygalactose transaminase